MAIGGWKPAIWLDANLEKGSSGKSNTFDNDLLTDENFFVKDIECWALDESVASDVVKSHPSRSDFRSHDSNHSQEVCNQAYSKWRQLEECRQQGQFKFDDMHGSPYIGRDEMYLKRKAFEEEGAVDAGVTGRVRFRIADDLIRSSLTQNPSLSNLTAPSIMSPDWTRSLYL